MEPLDIFKVYVSLSIEDVANYVMEHPVLLSPSHWEAFNQWCLQQSVDRRKTCLKYLDGLKNIYESLTSGKLNYILGSGPVEKIWRQAEEGEISLDRACSLAGAEEVTCLLSPLYVTRVTQYAVRTAWKGQWQPAVALMRVLQAALDARNMVDDQSEMVDMAVRQWMIVVGAAVSHVPDGSIFSDAVSRAKKLETELKKHDDQEGLRWLYQDMGALYLDTYTKGRSSANYMAQFEQWQRRAQDEFGRSMATIKDEEMKMPPPEEAFSKAADYMRKAAKLGTGENRARSLKGLAEALMWTDIIGAPMDASEAMAAAREAISVLNQENNSEHHAAILGILHYFDPKEGDAALELESPQKPDLEAMIRKFGPERAAMECIRIAGLLLQKNKAREALETMDELRPVVEGSGLEKLANLFYQHEVNIMSQALGRIDLDRVPDQSLQDLEEECFTRAASENWSPQELAASLVGIARKGATSDAESIALPILKKTYEIDPQLTLYFSKGLMNLKTILLTGSAVNALNAGNIDEAVILYFDSLRVALDMDFGLAATELLRRIDDLVPQAEEEGLQHIVAGLAEASLKVEALVGRNATEIIQSICRQTMSRIVSRGAMNIELLTFLWQIAKGMGFTAALCRESEYNWREDDKGSEILERINHLSSKIESLEEEKDEKILLDDHLLLAAYISPGDRGAGDSPEQMVENLQHQYDSLVDRQMRGGFQFDIERMYRSDQIKAMLDHKSALLEYFLGDGPGGTIAIYTRLMTDDKIEITSGIGNFPSSTVFMGGDGRDIQVHPYAPWLSEIRKALVEEDPYPRNVSPKLMENLDEVYKSVLGGELPRWLARLKSEGRSHLYIAPHGPFHFFPFHLLGPNGEPLAGDWAITYLPSLALLNDTAFRDRAGEVSPRIGAFGIDFSPGNPHNLPELTNASKEAQAIASLFNTQAVVNEAATENAFFQAFAAATHIHVATHGCHRVVAPAFQHIFLMPGDGNDGIVYAYELLDLNLQHVDLLTLSACETALGRFDLGDNLRGLPASFLVAGVKTVVGTLWEVETETAETFFTTMYKEIRNGTAKVAAFHRAQMTTRDQFPNYRDWGAFFLYGQA